MLVQRDYGQSRHTGAHVEGAACCFVYHGPSAVGPARQHARQRQGYCTRPPPPMCPICVLWSIAHEATSGVPFNTLSGVTVHSLRDFISRRYASGSVMGTSENVPASSARTSVSGRPLQAYDRKRYFARPPWLVYAVGLE